LNMFKIIVIIDCNICGQPFDHIATSSERDPLSWKSLALDLEYTSERAGWSRYRSAHHCSDCITDVAFSLRQAVDEAREAKKTN
jgi:hypothetical protein